MEVKSITINFEEIEMARGDKLLIISKELYH